MLLPEYKKRNKVNKLIDRRIVTTEDMDEDQREENVIRKFTLERQVGTIYIRITIFPQ